MSDVFDLTLKIENYRRLKSTTSLMQPPPVLKINKLCILFMSWIFKFVVVLTCAVVAYFEPIRGAVNIFICAFVADFVTGLLASFKLGERFKSSKARWSFAKLLCYTGSFMFLLVIGKNLQALHQAGDDYASMLWLIKMVVYAGVWFETKSIVENLQVLFPENRFLSFLDYLLGVEFTKKIPGLANFLKEDKNKNSEK